MPVNEGNLLVWGYEGVEPNTLSQAPSGPAPNAPKPPPKDYGD